MRYCKQYVVPPTHITIHNSYVHNSSFASPKKFTTQCQASVQPPLTQLLQPTVVLVVQRPQAVGVKLTEICEDISKVSLVSGISRSMGFNCKLSRSTGCWREAFWAFELATTEAFTVYYAGVQNPAKVNLSVLHAVLRLFSTTSFGFAERFSCLKNLAKQRGFFRPKQAAWWTHNPQQYAQNPSMSTTNKERHIKHLVHMSCRFPRRPGKVEKLCHLAIQPKADESNAYLWLIGTKTDCDRLESSLHQTNLQVSRWERNTEIFTMDCPMSIKCPTSGKCNHWSVQNPQVSDLLFCPQRCSDNQSTVTNLWWIELAYDPRDSLCKHRFPKDFAICTHQSQEHIWTR